MSKWHKLANATLEEIISALERELPPPFRVIREPRRERALLGLRAVPTVVVYDEETLQITLIEVEIAPPYDDDLGLGPVARVHNLREQNAMLNPRVVLVSLARISEWIEGLLAKEDVAVIRGRTADEVIPALLDFVGAGSVAHR